MYTDVYRCLIYACRLLAMGRNMDGMPFTIRNRDTRNHRPVGAARNGQQNRGRIEQVPQVQANVKIRRTEVHPKVLTD
jgi:hypothetical protein